MDQLTIGVVQMEPNVGKKQENIEKTLQFIEEAATGGAKLIVLPELANTGCIMSSLEEAHSLAEAVPGGESVAAWEKVAVDHQVYLVAGILESEGQKLYNCAVLIGPEGFLGKYRKNHLWYEDKLYYEPGNLGFPVFDTPIGKIGMLICYDLSFPESVRIQALLGADVIAVPMNIPGEEDQAYDARGWSMVNYRAVAYGNVNKVFLACANRVGEERNTRFTGTSIITSCDGWPLAGPAEKNLETILYAQVDILQKRRLQKLNLDEALSDRRTDLYDLYLGYCENRI